MRRRLAWVVGVLAAAAFATAASAQNAILVSGQPALVIVDGNGDGPGTGDCMLNAFLAGNALSIFSTQDTTTPIRLCGSTYGGTASFGNDGSSNFSDVTILTSTPLPAALPITAEFVDETPNPGTPPLRINDPLDGVTLTGASPDVALGSGKLCNADGPASMVTLRNGITLLRQLSFFPNAQNPTHLCTPNVPFERIPLGSFVFLNAYIPVNPDKTLTVATTNAPTNLLVDIDLNNLPLCPGRANAPTLGEGKLLGLMVALLVVGTWAIRRRPAFAESLSIP